MAKIEVIEKDTQFRLRIQVNFRDDLAENGEARETQTVQAPKVGGRDGPRGEGRKPPMEKKPPVKIYKAQSGDGRKKKPKGEESVVEFYTDWLADTPMNRHIGIVWLRLLIDEQGEALMPFRELSLMVDSTNRQASSQHVEDFRERGEEFQAFVMRKRKVNEEVVECVEEEVLKGPLLGEGERASRVCERLKRRDITAANIEAALEQISCKAVLRKLRKQMGQGEAHYKESYLLEEMMKELSEGSGVAFGLEGAYVGDMLGRG